MNYSKHLSRQVTTTDDEFFLSQISGTSIKLGEVKRLDEVDTLLEVDKLEDVDTLKFQSQQYGLAEAFVKTNIRNNKDNW